VCQYLQVFITNFHYYMHQLRNLITYALLIATTEKLMNKHQN
uniref:Uncharacterized protein n=1 Tax=Aegilops tauschii subsp. strangulata TaxID=200361 RepID=A0A453C8M5_AEGTS